ncbi:DUF4197 domain-containing protein [Dasania marina]|uniref:DUF4197 domain-containing protein n=1 Tax=Dasania marina TaxID=471499 RepID=UPI0003791CE1|nr:DUF4197 domain-containing protein [Dasania marina]
MKAIKRRQLLGMLLCCSVVTSVSVYAEDSWWQKGLNSLKTLKADQPIASELSADDMAAAFKQALQLGSDKVVTQLAKVDGFNTDPAIHIPLPAAINQAKALLDKVGMAAAVDELELKLNRAAELATPKAQALFVEAIKTMTFDDVRAIYQGPEDSATQYFKSKMQSSLAAEMQPIVNDSLSQVGAIKVYEQLISEYKSLPFVPDLTANLNEHVVNKGMDGIFYYLAKEEAAIRKDPVQQTTVLLKKVFGSQ